MSKNVCFRLRVSNVLSQGLGVPEFFHVRVKKDLGNTFQFLTRHFFSRTLPKMMCFSIKGKRVSL